MIMKTNDEVIQAKVVVLSVSGGRLKSGVQDQHTLMAPSLAHA